MSQRPNKRSLACKLAQILAVGVCALTMGHSLAQETSEPSENTSVVARVPEAQARAPNIEIRMQHAEEAIEEGRPVRALWMLAAYPRWNRATPELHAEILFLQARAFHALDMVPETLGTLKYLQHMYPESTYARRLAEVFPQLAAPAE